ncbi:MAG: hypothetical protein ACE14L_16735 [Terriglobales bacterium]
MQGEDQFEMQCGEFEASLADALDGTLTATRRAAFDAHRARCAHCAPLYAEAESGLRWLEALKLEEVEPPARLMENILKATSWAELPAGQPRKSWWQRLREYPPLAPVFGTILQPRFAMSFAMAFFSVSVLLNLTGVKMRDLRHLDLRPSALIQALDKTQGRIVSYYENIRFVYEIESRVRDLKRATTPEPPEQRPEQQRQLKDNRTGEPNQERYRNYSLDEARPLLARCEGALRQQRRLA